MQDRAYDAMRMMQERHWWWRGMRHVYYMALKQFLRPQEDKKRYIVDVGCGFGANLQPLGKFGIVVGVDVSLEALQAIKHPQLLGLVQAAADALPFRTNTFDVVALLAVIEHVDHDEVVLSEAYRVGKNGSIQLMLTSAFMALWSHHDVANNHRRRYYAVQFDKLLKASGWHKLRTSYINSFIFPAVFIIRSLQRYTKPIQTSNYDMGPDLGFINKLFEVLLILEGWWTLTTGIGLPFGVDLFNVSIHDLPSGHP